MAPTGEKSGREASGKAVRTVENRREEAEEKKKEQSPGTGTGTESGGGGAGGSSHGRECTY